jgi:hypothetical protein
MVRDDNLKPGFSGTNDLSHFTSMVNHLFCDTIILLKRFQILVVKQQSSLS